jgi:hypothetical protein
MMTDPRLSARIRRFHMKANWFATKIYMRSCNLLGYAAFCAMRSLKRRRETDLLIKVAAGEPLEAESLLLRSLSCAVSDSARGLPAAAEEWDVSGLLLDGQPFTRETVSCWLSCAYSAIHGTVLGS